MKKRFSLICTACLLQTLWQFVQQRSRTVATSNKMYLMFGQIVSVDVKMTIKFARTINNAPNQQWCSSFIVDQSEHHRKDQTLESNLTLSCEISYVSTACKKYSITVYGSHMRVKSNRAAISRKIWGKWQQRQLATIKEPNYQQV